MASIHQMFREFANLDRKRSGDGVTPLEYQRWKHLNQELARAFDGGRRGAGVERRGSLRVPTRLKLSFQTEGRLGQAVMRNLSRGGLFIATAFPAEVGTRLDLRVRIESSGEMLEIPVEVVTTHVGPGGTTQALGMGVSFVNPTPELRKKLDELYASVRLDVPGEPPDEA